MKLSSLILLVAGAAAIKIRDDLDLPPLENEADKRLEKEMA